MLLVEVGMKHFELKHQNYKVDLKQTLSTEINYPISYSIENGLITLPKNMCFFIPKQLYFYRLIQSIKILKY